MEKISFETGVLLPCIATGWSLSQSKIRGPPHFVTLELWAVCRVAYQMPRRQ